MSDREVVALGVYGSAGGCDHSEDKLGRMYVTSREGDQIRVKSYCECGARVYGTVTLRPDDEIEEVKGTKYPLLVLIRKKLA